MTSGPLILRPLVKRKAGGSLIWRQKEEEEKEREKDKRKLVCVRIQSREIVGNFGGRKVETTKISKDVDTFLEGITVCNDHPRSIFTLINLNPSTFYAICILIYYKHVTSARTSC